MTLRVNSRFVCTDLANDTPCRLAIATVKGLRLNKAAFQKVEKA